MNWSRRYTYEESGAGIFTALALVARFPEEVDAAIDHIAGLDLDHEIQEGGYIFLLAKHLGYNETTVRLVAARATICCGQHGREDLESFLDTLDLAGDRKQRAAFVEAIAAFEMRSALTQAGSPTAEKERVRHLLDEEIDEWRDDYLLGKAGLSDLGPEIADRARELFEQHEYLEPIEIESPDEKLGRLAHDWRAARGELEGKTPNEQLLDAVGAAYADTTLLFPGNPTREQLQQLIDAGADGDAADPAGRTALWLASKHDLLAAVDFLIDQGADLTTAGEYNTALHKAVSYGHSEVAHRLADAGADVDDAVWDAALVRLKEPEQNRLAEIAANSGRACKRAKAQAAITSVGLTSEERQTLEKKAEGDLSANLLLTKAEATAGDDGRIAARLLPWFSEPETWQNRKHFELLPFLFDALRRLGRAEEGIELWRVFRFKTSDSWLPPRLLPALIECYAAAGRFEAALGEISSYSYKVERTFCDKES